MMPEDVAELEAYIKQQGLIIIGYSNTENKPNILDSLVELTELKAFFILPEFIDHVKMRFVEKQNKYVIIDKSAPVIEYRKANYKKEEGLMRTGRLYFIKYLFDKDNNQYLKDDKTCSVANELFKWYRKNFKNAKINNWHTTQKVAEAVENNSLNLKTTY